MRSQSYQQIGIAFLLITVSTCYTYQSSHKEARQYFGNIVHKTPSGFLVLKTNTPTSGNMGLTIDLAGNFGSSPGLKHKSYGTTSTINNGLTIEVRYIPENSVHFGDPLLIRFALPSGIVTDFIVKNGDFKKIYQDKDYTLDYLPNPKTTP